jgi:predicted metal-binding membrane protein
MDNEEPSPKPVNGNKVILWVFVVFFTIALTIYMFYVPSATTFIYTYQHPPGSPGVLISDRWGKDFWLMGLLNLLWLIPLSILFMMEDMQSTGRRITHAIILCALTLYVIAVLSAWSFNYMSANNADGANWNNPANDPRWCLVHYGAVGAKCFAVAPASPAVNELDLIVDRLFVFRFWYLFAMLGVLLIYVAVFFTWIMKYTTPKGYTLLPTKSRMTFMKKKLLQ